MRHSHKLVLKTRSTNVLQTRSRRGELDSEKRARAKAGANEGEVQYYILSTVSAVSVVAWRSMHLTFTAEDASSSRILTCCAGVGTQATGAHAASKFVGCLLGLRCPLIISWSVMVPWSLQPLQPASEPVPACGPVLECCSAGLQQLSSAAASLVEL